MYLRGPTLLHSSNGISNQDLSVLALLAHFVFFQRSFMLPVPVPLDCYIRLQQTATPHPNFWHYLRIYLFQYYSLPSPERSTITSDISSYSCKLLTYLSPISLGSSRHVWTRFVMFDVSTPCILAVSSLSSITDRHDELDWLDASNVSCRVVT